MRGLRPLTPTPEGRLAQNALSCEFNLEKNPETPEDYDFHSLKGSIFSETPETRNTGSPKPPTLEIVEGTFPVKLSRVSECVVDSSHGTNSSNFEMFVLIVPFRGEGYPLSFFFIQESAEVRIAYLESWFTLLQQQYAVALFVHMDKDASKIAATQRAWPGAKISLCLWHMDRAVRMRFKKLYQLPDKKR
ncbi:hypothetical protein DYB37_011609 [Aphanomyces astaci]|uniref:Uncharacterized protein n=1 Tax=Aphanomyces astaci TaxID=112090 RepID=A0A3R7BHK5_APHAT|nr:hypothetical protein DYB35_009173 [Aphanomyces astaci]RHZ24576.1 hypothetical protein DYB37_011609 [Aphanomyces astaci]